MGESFGGSYLYSGSYQGMMHAMVVWCMSPPVKIQGLIRQGDRNVSAKCLQSAVEETVKTAV
jgi:hypothetical protein